MDIALTNKEKKIVSYTKVSPEDYDRVIKYNWYRNNAKGPRIYVVGTVNGKRTALHHFIAGKPQKGLVVDHINNDTLDNRRENLRIVTLSHNNQNNKKKKGLSSQYLGVYFSKDSKNWVATHSSKNLGSFESEIDAAKEYDKHIMIK